ncbi:MAG: hypothetical protein AB1726_13370 [Planctomycetota bacterium]
MISADPLQPLLVLAATSGFLHTVAGPDHYVPFVAMARARSWSWPRTALVTALCGVGHVLGSVALGLVGLAAGAALFRLEAIEAARGELAAWLMIAFGLVYAAWGWRWRARRAERAHEHAEAGARGEAITPWVLFTIFVFGPCEVLIPQLMVPAAMGEQRDVVLVVAVFAGTTIATMLGMVFVLLSGVHRLRFAWLQRHPHELAGAVVSACGLTILLGW